MLYSHWSRSIQLPYLVTNQKPAVQIKRLPALDGKEGIRPLEQQGQECILVKKDDQQPFAKEPIDPCQEGDRDSGAYEVGAGQVEEKINSCQAQVRAKRTKIVDRSPL